MAKPRTFHIQWHITDACNLRCRHCYQDSFSPARNLSLSGIRRIVGNLNSFLEETGRKLTVDLTGGEPLVFPYFHEILKLLDSRESVERIGLITNGILFDEPMLELLSGINKMKIIKISCEACTKQAYERIRGKKYDSFIRGLSLVKRFSGEKILIFTLFEENVGQIPVLFDFAEEFGMDGFIVERFFPMGTGLKMKESLIKPENWKKVAGYLLARCSLPADLELIAPYRGFYLKKETGEWNIYGAPCIAGKAGCAIMREGNVYPCRRFGASIGNAVREPFADIWKRNPCRNLRRNHLKGKCGLCKIRSCKGCRALARCLTGDYLAEDPLCFLM